MSQNTIFALQALINSLQTINLGIATLLPQGWKFAVGQLIFGALVGGLNQFVTKLANESIPPSVADAQKLAATAASLEKEK